MHPRSAVAWTLFLATLTACARGSDTPDLPAWTVAAEPTTVVGQMDGDSVYLFQSVRDAAFLPDGRIVVADDGLLVLRVYDPRGRFLRQMGRRGGGPGDLMSIGGIWISAPDTVGVWDVAARRLTWFPMGGGSPRSVLVEPAMESMGVGHLDLAVGSFPDGSVALGSITAGSADGTGQDRMSVERFGPDGEHLERIAEVPGMIRGPAGPGPFSPFPYFATSGGGVYFTNGGTPEVRIWRRGSGPDVGWTEDTLQLPAAQNDPEGAWRALPPMLEAHNEAWLPFLDQAVPPDSIPHLAGLVVDDAGRIWTKSYDAPGDALWLNRTGVRGGTWWVVGPDGGLLATAVLPDRFAPLQITGERVLGRTVDALGVERVEVHDLDRGG